MSTLCGLGGLGEQLKKIIYNYLDNVTFTEFPFALSLSKGIMRGSTSSPRPGKARQF
jgi:hypothetical protein